MTMRMAFFPPCHRVFRLSLSVKSLTLKWVWVALIRLDFG
jgi:hypothetical protein